MSTQPPSATPGNLRAMDFAAFSQLMAPQLDSILAEYKTIGPTSSVDKAQALKDMYALVQGTYPLQETASDFQPVSFAVETAAVEGTESDSCTEWIVTCVADCIAMFLQLCGIQFQVARNLVRPLIGELPAQTLYGCRALITELRQATTPLSKATTIFRIIGAGWKALGLRQILGAFETHFAWYQWVLLATVITAQSVLLFGSEGTAMIAELVIMTAFIAQTVADATSAVNACGSDSQPAPAAP